MEGTLSPQDMATRDALAERLFGALNATFDLYAIYLGDRLGYYQALASGEALTSAELAAQTGTAERYTREWLEQQAVTAILELAADDSMDGATRRFRLPAAHAEVLTNAHSLSYLVPYGRAVVGSGQALPAVLEAYRTGRGVPYEDYGVDVREGIAHGNRPMFDQLLGATWCPAIPDLHARLQADPPARVIDVGCGEGWSSIAIGRAYPNARVDGIDLDTASIATARANAAAVGLADRVTFHAADAVDARGNGRYDLACAFECLHDMADPVGALRTMRELVGAEGTVLIVDERVPEVFAAPGDDIDRFMYGFSVIHCLPVGLAEQPSAATGTVMRPDTLRRYAKDAGYQAVEVLPIENDFWRFYRLTP